MALVLFTLAMVPHWCGGATIRVDQARPGADGGDGASWSTAFQTVGAAMTSAGSGDEIWVARGTYPERITLKVGVKLYGGFNATESLLSARDWRLNHSILDGQASGTVVIVAPGAGADTRIDGLVIRNGYGGPGGGIHVTDGSPVISNNRIADNAATVTGGGIYLFNSSALVVSNRIVGNFLTNYQDFVMAGGGGLVSRGGSPEIRGNLIAQNRAQYGGGIRIWEGQAKLEGNHLVANQAQDLGGGIEVAFGSTVIEGNRIVANRVLQGGSGGVSVVGAAVTVFRNNLLLVNQSFSGVGGVYFEAGTQLLLAGNTLLANHGQNSSFDRSLEISGGNFDAANNIVAFGGSVLLSSNTGWRHNCVFGNVNGNYEGGSSDPTGSNGNISVDPMLGWSRERAEFHLQPGSPCIGAGTMTSVTLGELDIDGEARVFGGAVDIGADELGNEPLSFVPRVVRVAVSGNDANDGSVWLAAKRTIQAALNDAMLDGGEIWVAAGVYAESIDLRPLVKLFGGFAGTEAARAERNSEINETVIDGGGLTNVVRGEYLDWVAELNGFTIRNGRAPRGGGIKLRYAPINIVGNRLRGNGALLIQSGGSEGPPDAGGAIFTDASDAFIVGNAIQENFAMQGGAIYVRRGRPFIQRNLIMGNVATNLGSAAATSAGIMLAGAGAEVANNLFLANRLIVDGGSRNAAAAIWADQPARIINNTFMGNIADHVFSHPSLPGSSVRQAAVFVNANGSLVANNVFSHNIQGIRTSSHPNQTIVNNCFFQQLGANFSGMPTPDASASNLFADPRLVGPYASLHLVADSPCRNAGDNAHVAAGWLDADGDERILEGTVDIGADEFTGSVPMVPLRLIHVRVDGDDQASGRSWLQAKRTVQAGLDQALAMGGAEVWVARGEYQELIQVKPFTYLHGGFFGNETSTTGRDLLANQTVINARQLGTAVTIDAPGTFSALTGFTIINGRGFFAGGVYCRPLSAPLIANNRIFNCSVGMVGASWELGEIDRYAGGAGIRVEAAAPVIINNIIASNNAPAIILFGRLHAGGAAISLTAGAAAVVANNTIARNVNRSGIGALSISYSSAEVRNNIFAFGTGGISALESIPLIDNNCFFENETAGLTGSLGLSFDPQFADDRITYFLAPTSPCIDGGLPEALPPAGVDVYGRSRIVGNAPDFGAFEWQAGDSVAAVTLIPSFSIEVVGGIAYLRYDRSVVGGELGELVPTPTVVGTNIFWTFTNRRDLSAPAVPGTYSGSLPLGGLPPYGLQLIATSWGIPQATLSFFNSPFSEETIVNPVVTAAGLEFSLNGIELATYITEQSVGWGAWTTVATNRSASGSVLIPGDFLTGQDFFRVRVEPLETAVP